MIFFSWVIFGTNFLFYQRVFSEAFICKPSIKTHWNLHKMAANLQLCSFRSLKISSLTQTHRFFFILEELQALYMNSCVLLVYQCYLGRSQSLICNWNNSSFLIILSVIVFPWKHEVLRLPASQKTIFCHTWQLFVSRPSLQLLALQLEKLCQEDLIFAGRSWSKT